MSEIVKAFQQLKERVSTLPRWPLVQLNEPIGADGIAMLVAAVGRLPPAPVVELLQIHDGESGSAGILGSNTHLMSASEIAAYYLEAKRNSEEQDEFVNAIGPVEPKFFDLGRIPFAEINESIAWFDFSPPADGRYGQIIFVDLVNGSVRVVSNSVSELFAVIGHRIG
jgi:cell wall assembly regulator SMI1